MGDGTQRRDFTYIADVVAANVLAGSLDLPYNYRVWNVGCGKNYSINEIADMIGGEKIHVPPRSAEVHVTLADIDDTTKELGWKPTRELEDMINFY